MGYTGGQRHVPGMVVCMPDDHVLKKRRVIVEQFFGRLKGVWRAFSEKWHLDEAPFDLFFDIACALTNIDIFIRPLRRQDRRFNKGIFNLILEDLEEKARKQKEYNQEYQTRRRLSLQNDDSDSSTEVLEPED